MNFPVDERPRKGQFKAGSPLRDVPIDDLGIQRTIREIKTIAARNDHNLFTITEQCQNVFTDHTQKVSLTQEKIKEIHRDFLGEFTEKAAIVQ